MSKNNTDYLDAVRRTALIQPNPEGFSEFDAPATQDKIMIKQNNTIIELLIQLNNRVDRLIQATTITQIPQVPNYSAELELITTKLGNLTLPEEARKKDLPSKQYKFGTPRK